MEQYTKQELDRFNSKWNQEGACWIWQRSLDKDGYGTFYFKKLNRRAHRVSYFIHVGEIPKGLVIDHTCSTPSCVNPKHLRTLTARENTMLGNGIGARNARKTTCKKGHPFDRQYGKQRYCSICENAKSRRLQAKWRREDKILC